MSHSNTIEIRLHGEATAEEPAECHSYQLSAADTEALAEGDLRILDRARERARGQSEAAVRWNITAARARMPSVPTRIDILDVDGVVLASEDASA